MLLIHSKGDTITAPAGAKGVMKRIDSKHKQLVWLERSHHLIMYDRENDTVLNAMKDFLLEGF
ncbi:MAG: hypothetical protein E3K37_06915 [Candidatus Kuenenia sp.]|nr:hypothetical protein [Candidatus Kuenenia hertensis]